MKRFGRGADGSRIDGREIALEVDDGRRGAIGIECCKRLGYPVRTRGVIVAGHHRLEAGPGDRAGDASVVSRHRDPADIGFGGTPRDLDDHRRSENVGERLSRQAGRRHARGDENEC